MVKIYVEQKDTDVLRAKGSVDDLPMEMVLDTGASISIMSKEIAERHNFELFNSNIKIKSISGETIKPIGRTKEVNVKIDTNETKISFIVLESQEYDVILGIDWFNKTEAGIYPKAKKLHFPKNEIHDEEEETTVSVLTIGDIADSQDVENTDEWNFDKAETSSTIKHGISFKEKEASQFLRLSRKIQASSAETIEDLGLSNVGEFEIELTTTGTIYQNPYRRSLKENEYINDEIKTMINAGIIELSKSSFSSPLVTVKKKDGSLRLCVDFRKLNAVTVSRKWPIKRVQDIFDKMSGSTIFTLIDCKSGYWQFAIKENCRQYTAFSTNNGHYQFKRVPFGLKNAPAFFCEMMFRILGHLPFVENFVDDIIIFSTTIEKHFQHVEHVLNLLNEAYLKINVAKCVWFTDSIRILGHQVSKNGISPDDSKIEVIKKRQEPTNVKQLQCFLGLANYYRRFVQDFSTLAKPLYELLKQNKKWEWTSECKKAFELLKVKLTEYPILKLPEPNNKFVLYTDASKVAIGAILAQVDNATNTEYVCAYNSRLIQGAEKNYSIQELECLAVVWAVKAYREYLHGVKFDVITDHNSLIWLFKLNDPHARIMRWILFLQIFDYEIKYRKGKNHANVDAISRPVLFARESRTLIDPYVDEALMYYLKHRKHLPGRASKQVKKIEEIANSYKIDKNERVTYKNWIVPKLEERKSLIEEAHRTGHFQSKTTCERLQRTHYWPGMYKDVIKCVKKCEKCQRHHVGKIFNHEAQSIQVNNIMDLIQVDCILGMPCSVEGYIGILLIIETLSKYLKLFPIRSKTAAEIAARLFEYIAIFGTPKGILSDRGTEFREVVNEMLTMMGIDHMVTASYNPRCNGLAERTNKTIIESLSKYCETNPTDWPLWLPFVTMCYNTKKHSSTNYTPEYLMFGRERNRFIDYEKQQDNSDIDNRVLEIKDLYETIHKDAIDNIRMRQEQQENSQDNRHNVIEKPLDIGTKVLVKNEGILKKMNAKYSNKCTVVGVDEHNNYELKNELGEVLKEKIPLHKLKVIPSEDVMIENVEKETKQDKIMEVQKILDHRKKNKQNEYLVKWKNLGNQHNEWVNEKDFMTTEIISNYWKRVNEKRNEAKNNVEEVREKKKRGRPRKITNRGLLTIAFVVFTLIMTTTGMRVDGNFYFCENENAPLVDFGSACNKMHTIGQTRFLEVTVLHKLHNNIFGYGYKCARTNRLYEFKTDLFNNPQVQEEAHEISLSSNDCWDMVRMNKCDDKNIECEGNKCFAEHKPEPEFRWMNKIVRKGFKCSYEIILIQAENEEATLFKSSHHCTIRDWSCRLHNSIIVWNASLIHECPFEEINTINMVQTSNNTLISSAHNLLFSIHKVHKEYETKCKADMHETTEGLYVIMTPLTENKTFEFKRSNLSLDNFEIKNDLFLSSIDSNSFKMLSLYFSISNTICEITKQLIETTVANKEGYAQVRIGKKSIILYTNNGLSYVPHCIQIKTIEVKEEVDICHEGLKVSIKIKDKNKDAFMDKNGIITSYSKRTSCLNNIRHFIIENNIITQNETKISMIMKKQVNKIDLRELLNIKVKNPNMYNHEDILKEPTFGIDEKVEIDFTEGGGDDYSIIENEKPTIEVLHERIEIIKEKINKLMKTIIAAICIIVLLIISIIISIKLTKVLKGDKTNKLKVRFSPGLEKIKWVSKQQTEEDQFMEFDEVAVKKKATNYNKKEKVYYNQPTTETDLGLQDLFNSSGR
jgi:hypothetical protein